MSETSARWALPLLQAGQAQKEVVHNEALAAIDALLHPCVEAVADLPPASPEDGRCWLIGAGAGGPWSGRAGQLACRTGGGWRYLSPAEGTVLWNRATGRIMRRTAGAWFAGAAPVETPTGGGIVDAEARAAVAAIIVALRSHGLIGS